MSLSNKVLRQLLVITSALIVLGGQAWATELWDPHLRGVDEGMAAGALPPPGVYGVLNSYWLSTTKYDSNGHKTAVRLDGIVEVPIVLWQTGLKVFGADYAVAIAQPFDYTNLRVAGAASLANNGHWGTYNTILIPGQLSWSLPYNLHLSTGLTVYVDDASSSPGNPPPGGGAGAGNGNWALQPDFGVSWLHDGWNLSLGAHYAYNFENTTTHYKSGQELALDYTATKTVGKWILGLGAHQETQLTDDTGAGAVLDHCPTSNGCKVSIFGLGPLVGYQFGGLEMMAEYNMNLSAKNNVAGNFLNIRLVTAL